MLQFIQTSRRIMALFVVGLAAGCERMGQKAMRRNDNCIVLKVRKFVMVVESSLIGPNIAVVCEDLLF